MQTYLNRHTNTLLSPHSYQKQMNIIETFPQKPVQSTTKIFPNILSNKSRQLIISLTHQAYSSSSNHSNRSYRRSNSLTPSFSLTHLIKLCFSQQGHDGSSVFTWQCPVLFPEQLCQVYLLGLSCRLFKPKPSLPCSAAKHQDVTCKKYVTHNFFPRVSKNI